MSVLTDQKYFGGSIEDLLAARASCSLPLLRKDFIIDPYQIMEAKAYGADVILLIASALSRAAIKSLSLCAHQLELEVLLEVHNQAELEKALMPSLDMIGVNNRNLKTFEVDLRHSRELSNYIPKDFVKVSESGIGNVAAIKGLKPHGFQGFLIGESFMKTDNPGESAKEFIKKLSA
jgi:indole-3-glycerol phosphate synthase